jgi:hypothetical protein
MKNNEKILLDHEIDAAGAAVRNQLNKVVDDVSDPVAARLAKAREAAVAKVAQQEALAASTVLSNGNTLALSQGGKNGGWRDRLSDWRFWATGLLVGAVIAVYAGNEYNESAQARDAAEIELMILGDDVPVDALLDKGFKSYLREEN